MHMYSGESGRSASAKKMEKKMKAILSMRWAQIIRPAYRVRVCAQLGCRFDLIFNVPRSNAGGRQFEP